jgi:hypothetical protein
MSEEFKLTVEQEERLTRPLLVSGLTTEQVIEIMIANRLVLFGIIRSLRDQLAAKEKEIIRLNKELIKAFKAIGNDDLAAERKKVEELKEILKELLYPSSPHNFVSIVDKAKNLLKS